MNNLGFIFLIVISVHLRYTECKNPAGFPPCMYGKPYKDSNNVTVDCWHHGKPENCPYSHECKFDSHQMYSICCLKEYEYNPCVIGKPLKYKNSNLSRTCGFDKENCPAGYVCKMDPSFSISACCFKGPSGRHLAHIQSEDLILCDKTNPCPYSHDCIQVDPNQDNGYCKLRTITYGMKTDNPCLMGSPYKSPGAEKPLDCSKKDESCPPPYECRIDSAAQYAVCCKREKSFNPCHIGYPYMIENRTVYCGPGEHRKECPKNYSCKIDEDGAYAVCCLHHDISFVDDYN